MWRTLGKALGNLARVADRLLSRNERRCEAQSRINESEVSGAPQSRLRLWRSFLGWALSLLFVWARVEGSNPFSLTKDFNGLR